MKQKIGIISELQDRVKGKRLLIAPAHERSSYYARHLEKTALSINYYDGNENIKELRGVKVSHQPDLPGGNVEIIVITSLSHAEAIEDDIRRVLPGVEIIKIKDILEKHRREILAESSRSVQVDSKPGQPPAPTVSPAYAAMLAPLVQWLDNNDKAGFDPYDFEDYLIGKLKKHYYYKEGTPKYLAEQWKKEIFDQLEMHYLSQENQNNPGMLRELLGIKPRINPKALGLILWSYARLYRHTRNFDILLRAKDYAQWLLDNYCTAYTGKSWGYPFDWQSIIFIPAGTPSTTVSVTVGNGFFQLYKATGEKRYLDVCRDICVFLQKAINRTYNLDGICFSYTPLDYFQVNNASLFTAEFLIRVGRETDQFYWIGLGKTAADFVLKQQNSDGSIYYWSKAQDHHAPRALDIYHTALKTRTLKNIGILTGDNRYIDAADRLFRFFLGYFFHPDGGIRKDREENIHGTADAILALCAQAQNPRHREILEKLIEDALTRHQYKPGEFSYKVNPDGKRADFPFHRWGQAWMLRALSEYLLIRENASFLIEEHPPALTGNRQQEDTANYILELFRDYAAVGESEAGLYFIKKAVSNGIHHPGLHEILLQYYLEKNQTEEFDFYLDRSVNLYPAEKRHTQFYLELLIRRNRLAEAYRQARQWAEETRQATAELLKDLNDAEKNAYFAASGYGTKKWLEDFYETSTSDPWNHHNRGTQLDRYQASLSLLKQHDITPGSSDTPGPSFEILDIGCALGHFTHRLREGYPDAKITGIDLAAKAVQRASHLWKDIEFRQGSLPVLDFPDHSFDLVTALEVASYQKKAGPRLLQFEEMKRVLKPNGHLLFSISYDPYPYFWGDELREFFLELGMQILSHTYLYQRRYIQIEKELLKHREFLENQSILSANKHYRDLLEEYSRFTANPEWVEMYEKLAPTFEPNFKEPSHIIMLLKNNKNQ